MPLYEFRCSACGEKFEEIVSSSLSQDVVCPECGEGKPERLMSTFATVGGDGASSFSSSASSGGCGGSSGFS
jgi:putative FmdB family regulatory protein